MTFLRSMSFALFATALAALTAAPAGAFERKPRESYADCKRRISSVPPCTKWTRDCAQRCGFAY